MTATMMEPRFRPDTPPPPNRLNRNPPTRAPAIPIRMVTMIPPGSRPDQLAKLPSDASHLVGAIGGNDVLASVELMRSPARSVADALVKLGDRATRFERAYRTMIDRVRRLGLSTTVCTIYNGNLSKDEAAVARVGLTGIQRRNPSRRLRVQIPGHRPAPRVQRALPLRQSNRAVLGRRLKI